MPPVGSPHTLVSEYASEVRSLPLVRKQLEELLGETPVGREKRWDIRLAVTEACSNVIRHAYGESSGTFQVAGELAQGRLEVTVRDAGRGSRETLSPRGGMLPPTPCRSRTGSPA